MVGKYWKTYLYSERNRKLGYSEWLDSFESIQQKDLFRFVHESLLKVPLLYQCRWQKSLFWDKRVMGIQFVKFKSP